MSSATQFVLKVAENSLPVILNRIFDSLHEVQILFLGLVLLVNESKSLIRIILLIIATCATSITHSTVKAGIDFEEAKTKNIFIKIFVLFGIILASSVSIAFQALSAGYYCEDCTTASIAVLWTNVILSSIYFLYAISLFGVHFIWGCDVANEVE